MIDRYIDRFSRTYYNKYVKYLPIKLYYNYTVYRLDLQVYNKKTSHMVGRYLTHFYKHQGRKPTTLEWWDECRLID